MDKNEKKDAKNPRVGANPLSVACFAWLWKIFQIGYKRELEETDLFSPLDSHNSRVIGESLEKIWRQEENDSKTKSKSSKSKPRLWKALAKCFGKEMIVVGLVQAIMEFLVTLPQPIVLGKLLRYFNGKNTMTENEAYIWAGLFTFLYIFKCPFYHLSIHSMIHLGMKVRVSCCSLIYRKVLRISKSSEADATAGQIVNLLSNDVNTLDYALPFFHYIWIAPIQLLVIAYIIYDEVDLPALTGIGLYLLIIPLQGYIGKFVAKLTLQAAYKTDKRLRIMNEIIGGVQVIKMYAWEKPFSRLVDKSREKEISAIRKNAFLDAVAMAFESYAPRVCIFVTVVTYALLGNAITAEKVFMISAFYNDMRYSLSIAFPLGIQRIAKAMASIKRIEDFMELEEIHHLKSEESKKHTNGFYSKNTSLSTSDIGVSVNGETAKWSRDTHEKPRNISFNAQNENVSAIVDQNTKPEIAVTIKNATAKWSKDSSDDTLKNINFSAKRGELTAIIGQVGAGKTSLFNVILQELPLISGKLEVHGKVVYVSQEPWIFASSIRQNILFGQPMNKGRYDKVLRVCQLEKDFIMFPHKDQTIIGEKGINLSGGQRARINLARAVYAEADVYLLDDPLSAVDAHVGRSLFEECVCDYLKEKTIILVTHQLQYLNSVDRVYVLSNGRVEVEGSFQALRNSGLDFLSVLQATEETEEKEEDEKDVKSLMSEAELGDVTSDHEREEVAEHRTTGKISSQVYWSYFKAVGSLSFVLLMLGLSIVQQIIASSGDYFVSYWVNVEEARNISDNISTYLNYTEEEMKDRLWYVYVYSGLIVATVISVYVRTFVYFEMCLMSSKNLHSSMFYNIIRATMSFFHTNPSGRIMNRFSKDIGLVDRYLPLSMNDVLEIFLFLVAVMIMTTIVNFWLVIPTVITGFLFYFLKSIYIKTSRSVKRLEGITRSPVFSHLSATLQGLITVRAFKAQELLTKEFDNHQDHHSASWYLYFSCSRAFGYYLELICSIYVGIVIYSFLLLAGEKAVGDVGLIITQCILLSGMLQWGIIQTAELENQMTSVERVLEYTKVPQEPPLESEPDKKPPLEWPTSGRVEFKNVGLRYSVGGELVLKNLSFVVEPNEKVGIVGRTGAGKSSLIAALFRLANIEGEIYIDGVQTGNLGLHDLRSKISIIPQEPLLFAGTLRENLDPFEEFTDEMLWQCLSEVELKDDVADAGLYGKVTDGGANFSVGQRQLLCLARAIVRNNKILVLDEATANVDPQTDGLIQKTIRKRFKDCTVFIIAHRLNTVMDCDKFIVMDAGHMVEFDHPFLLLDKRKGYLYEMVQQTGSEMADVLIKMAESSYQNKMPNQNM
ncbi:probable multidrug resistance-associated protein lethal(2)03659 [Belonocnema kinseyi]|uniref:probable multidrug resistance-associated protein lethal(2)03659 n=1 Tax=Belonocnema kinseyi TaxID=2817044 RepID=UPI00143D5A51|nr:probable multidrug resistance-associated protein lethal(2)03659 [Belonocnema kinseyi]XP_033208094.1 probable multidrug resistance-associated protein lethal(2)03659 [Belonocnema kinseyi]XP_033208101.1 probable multidrug resistance-associated protein lethal(2)03659 [Belonocnema kinseyi]